MITTKSPASPSDLRAVPLTTPAHAQGRWQGVGHGDLVREFDLAMRQRGWTPAEFSAYVSNNESAMAGGWASLFPTHTDTIDGFSLGFVNSNDWRSYSVALQCYAGVRVGGVSVPMLCLRMGSHTKGLDLTAVVGKTLDTCGRFFDRIDKPIQRLRDKTLRTEKAHELLWSAGEGRLLPWSRIGLVNREYKKGPQTAWALLLAFARIARLNPPMKQMDGVHRFYESLRKR